MKRTFSVFVISMVCLSLSACGAARTKREKTNLLSMSDAEICGTFASPKDGFEKEAARQIIEENNLWQNQDCINNYFARVSNSELCHGWAFGTRNHEAIADEIESRQISGQMCAELIAAREAQKARAAQASQNFYSGLTGLGLSVMQQGASTSTSSPTSSGFHSYTIGGTRYNCSTMGTVTNCMKN